MFSYLSFLNNQTRDMENRGGSFFRRSFSILSCGTHCPYNVQNVPYVFENNAYHVPDLYHPMHMLPKKPIIINTWRHGYRLHEHGNQNCTTSVHFYTEPNSSRVFGRALACEESRPALHYE